MSVETARELSRKINVLFWVSVIMVIANVLSEDFVNEIIGFSFAGNIAAAVCDIVYAVILIQIGGINGNYRKSGIASLAIGALGILSLLIAGVSISGELGLLVMFIIMAIAIVVLVIGIYGIYCEYKGHSEVLESLDKKQSEAWEKLWKWNIAGYACMACGMIFVTLSVILALICAFVGAVITFVVGIVKLVYLHRMAAFLNGYDGTVSKRAASETPAGAAQTSYVYAKPVKAPGDEETGKGNDTDEGDGEKGLQ